MGNPQQTDTRLCVLIKKCVCKKWNWTCFSLPNVVFQIEGSLKRVRKHFEVFTSGFHGMVGIPVCVCTIQCNYYLVFSLPAPSFRCPGNSPFLFTSLLICTFYLSSLAPLHPTTVAHRYGLKSPSTLETLEALAPRWPRPECLGLFGWVCFLPDPTKG